MTTCAKRVALRLWSAGEEQWVGCDVHTGSMAAVVTDLMGGQS